MQEFVANVNRAPNLRAYACLQEVSKTPESAVSSDEPSLEKELATTQSEPPKKATAIRDRSGLTISQKQSSCRKSPIRATPL
jgi:hypothetical protein